MADVDRDREEIEGEEKIEKEKVEQWKFTQWFRKMQNTANRQDEGDDYDHLTAVEFDDTGRFLATGDKSGNIVILENDSTKTNNQKNQVHYSFFGEFTSHYPDFDFVRSQQIEEKINQIKFGRQTNDALFLLTTNDRQIKLWKVKETEQYKLVNWNIDPSNSNMNIPAAGAGSSIQHKSSLNASFGVFTSLNLDRADPSLAGVSVKMKDFKSLKVPKKVVTEKAKMPHLRKMYATDVHQYNITSLSVSSDKESFISGDNLRINLWDFNIANQSYNVLDIKPEDMNELSEIISSLDFHPSSSHQFLYSTSLGNIMTCDLRTRALVDEPSQVFSMKMSNEKTMGASTGDAAGLGAGGEADQQTFFDEMTQNVTAAKFSKGGKFIISRDYMSVKIWDVTMERAPVETIYVHEYLRERMWDLYSSELLWDPFNLGISSTGDIVTGSYSNYFHIFDLGEKKDTFIQAAQPSVRTTDLYRSNKPKQIYGTTNDAASTNTQNKKKKTNFGAIGNFFSKKRKTKITKESKSASDEYPHNIDFTTIEFNKKILDCAWHPDSNAVAIAGQNNLYIYSKTATK